MSPAKARPARAGAKKMPTGLTVTADRLDSVLVGQFVQLDAPSLTGGVPSDGWFEVATVTVDAGEVRLTFVDKTGFAAPGDRLVRVGWM